MSDFFFVKSKLFKTIHFLTNSLNLYYYKGLNAFQFLYQMNSIASFG
jgi:hypothetical protein